MRKKIKDKLLGIETHVLMENKNKKGDMKMTKQYEIKSLEGIDWNAHYDYDNDIEFEFFFRNNLINVGDIVTVENKAECVLPLYDNEYCITFKKDLEDGGLFFMEVPFDLMECSLLFGDDFDY